MKHGGVFHLHFWVPIRPKVVAIRAWPVRGARTRKRSIERAGNLLLGELLQAARGLLVEENFFDEVGIAEVFETQGDAWGGGIHEPSNVALHFRADGFSGEALCGRDRPGVTWAPASPRRRACQSLAPAKKSAGRRRMSDSSTRSLLPRQRSSARNPWAVIPGPNSWWPFIHVGLLARFFATEVERACATVAPVANQIALGLLATVIHQAELIVGLDAIHATCKTVEEIEREINTGERGGGGFTNISEAVIEAELSKGAGGTVEVATNGLGLGSKGYRPMPSSRPSRTQFGCGR